MEMNPDERISPAETVPLIIVEPEILTVPVLLRSPFTFVDPEQLKSLQTMLPSTFEAPEQEKDSHFKISL